MCILNTCLLSLPDLKSWIYNKAGTIRQVQIPYPAGTLVSSLVISLRLTIFYFKIIYSSRDHIVFYGCELQLAGPHVVSRTIY